MRMSFDGIVRVHIITADMAQTLTIIAKNKITLFDVEYLDGLSFAANVRRNDYKRLKICVEKNGQKVKILKKEGLYWELKSLRRRPILVAGFLLVFLLCTLIPTRILFVKVEGNETVPSNLIAEKAEDCGIGFGASRREVRSEKIKNALLGKIPQLKWAGVTTKGCVATVSVREREPIEKEEPDGNKVGSIVATRDGIIQDYTVLRGTALCQIGQAVKAGQTLVSGYTDCGIAIRATLADAEVYAKTLREISLISMDPQQERGEVYKTQKRYSIAIGKKLLKLYKESGISDAGCVKMYSKEYLHLPGGFRLPLALICEEIIYYMDSDSVQAQEADYGWLEDSAASYLRSQMTAGKILSAQTEMERIDGACLMSGKYACTEMIGQIKSEEIISSGAKNG